jgi:hypothetical protein
MIKKLTLTAAAAVVLTLMLALPALAMRSAAAEPFGWDLQLRNTKTAKYSADLTYKAFAAWVAKSHRQVTITDSTVPTETVTYSGVSLKNLVGYFDDKDPATFNKALAKKGYSVVVFGMDGYSATFASADIAALGNMLIVANLADGQPLTVPKASLNDEGQPEWIPDWPLRVVSLDPSISGGKKVLGIVRLSIVKSVAPTAAALEPFGWDLQLRNTVTTKYGADLTYKAFASWVKGARRVTIVDDNKTPADPSDDTTYQGVSLKTLVGYFDDNNKGTFNAALATTGYNVVIVGMDGFAATIPSADIASLGDKIILADKANGLPLAVPAASLDRNGLPSWKPSWPLKVVSIDPAVTGKMKPGGVVRLSIVPAVAPTTGAAPF